MPSLVGSEMCIRDSNKHVWYPKTARQHDKVTQSTRDRTPQRAATKATSDQTDDRRLARSWLAGPSAAPPLLLRAAAIAVGPSAAAAANISLSSCCCLCCVRQVYVSYFQRRAESTTNTRNTQNHISYGITCLLRYSSSYLLVLLCTTSKTGVGRATAGDRRRANDVCTRQIQQQHYLQ